MTPCVIRAPRTLPKRKIQDLMLAKCPYALIHPSAESLLAPYVDTGNNGPYSSLAGGRLMSPYTAPLDGKINSWMLFDRIAFKTLNVPMSPFEKSTIGFVVPIRILVFAAKCHTMSWPFICFSKLS